MSAAGEPWLPKLKQQLLIILVFNIGAVHSGPRCLNRIFVVKMKWNTALLPFASRFE